MMHANYYICLVALGYICGSVPFGWLIARTQSVDIQKRGSGNIGFANVVRVLGWRAGAFTLAGDIVKGFIPALLALRLTDPNVAYWAGTGAIVGHIFPVWLRFHGGKGIATGLGLLLAFLPIAAALGIATYAISFAVLRNSARSSLIGTFSTFITGSIVQPHAWWKFGLLLAVAVWTHRKNITGKLPNYDI